MHGQVTLLDRPLPPGEGWGEGLVKSTSSLSTSLIVVSVERIEGVLLSDETSGHEATARPSPRQSFDSRAGTGRGQRLRHAFRACGNVTLTTERLVAAAPHPDPLPEGEGLEFGRYRSRRTPSTQRRRCTHKSRRSIALSLRERVGVRGSSKHASLSTITGRCSCRNFHLPSLRSRSHRQTFASAVARFLRR